MQIQRDVHRVDKITMDLQLSHKDSEQQHLEMSLQFTGPLTPKRVRSGTCADQICQNQSLPNLPKGRRETWRGQCWSRATSGGCARSPNLPWAPFWGKKTKGPWELFGALVQSNWPKSIATKFANARLGYVMVGLVWLG